MTIQILEKIIGRKKRLEDKTKYLVENLLDKTIDKAEKFFESNEQKNLINIYEKFGVQDIHFVIPKETSISASAIGLVGRRAESTIYFKDKSYFKFEFDDRESYCPSIKFVEPSTERKESRPYEEASSCFRGDVNGIVTVMANRDNLALGYVGAEIKVEKDGSPKGEKYSESDYKSLISDFHKKLDSLACMYNTTEFYAGEYWRPDLKPSERFPKYPILDSRYGFEKCLMYFRCNQEAIENKLELIVNKNTK